MPAAQPPTWSAALRQPAEWYATNEARELAGQVIRHQLPCGGWAKNTDLFGPPIAGGRREGTIDNQATTTPLRFLATVASAPDAAQASADHVRAEPRAAFERGLDYLFAAQYPNGGWPQYFPLRADYSAHITYNDDAMLHVLVLLREVAAGAEPFAFVDPARRARAAAAVERGISCILRTQVRHEGRLTVWCAQHDAATLAPAAARAFEPASLSGAESVGLTRFLMQIPEPGPEIIAAVEGAVAWFDQTKLDGLRVENFVDADGLPDRRLVADPSAPPLWARFYDLEQHRPLYLGRDGVTRRDFAGIERERRAGYAYHGTWAATLLERDYPRWRRAHAR